MSEPSRHPRVVIAGVTTRPLAVSAARAGYRVTAIDCFGDLDLRAVADVIVVRSEQVGRTYGPLAAAKAAAKVEAELATYTSNFENYPAAVARLATGRELLGNSPATLARVRDPLELSRVLRQHGLASLECRAHPPRRPTGRWLLKPRRSGGGHGITRWLQGAPVPRGMYLQRRMAGAPGSISFAADGSTASVLGFSRQLVGDRRFGVAGFRYCGSILASSDLPIFEQQQQLVLEASRVAQVLSREFQLRGLNGFDFIAHRGVPYPIEVNPRYSASMELIERGKGLSMFETHVRASAGELPPPFPRTPDHWVHGKAIVFARQGCWVGNSRNWLRQNWLADIPLGGTHIARGRPICTVFADGRTALECNRLLARRAARIYRAVKPSRRQAA
jgi:uncharacterized protein